jgi:RNA polymerase sigma-70 factor, ECF subfamily
MEKVMAGATTMGDVATAALVRADESGIIADLQSGSEEAYAWLINHYHQPVYSLVYRILNDPADAADTTQEVFLKVFRGIKRFNGSASLRTWVYRIAVHEASNQKRWWFRHKRKETSMETPADANGSSGSITLEDTLATDEQASPFEHMIHEEVRAKVEMELRQLPEPYRTAVLLRDIEGLAYEEIAEILDLSLGTVKSRLTRGRECLRKRLLPYVDEVGDELGLKERSREGERKSHPRNAKVERKLEVEIRR